MPTGSRSTARRRWRRFLSTVVVLAALGAAGFTLWLNQQEPAVPEGSAGYSTGTVVPDAQQARAQLDRLRVAWNRNWESYDRNAFGPGWSGHGGEPELPGGCTARETVMKRDLTETRLADSNSCLVLSGVLHDPYTGAQLPYDRFKASDIEIDHVVALGDAWRSGASEWDTPRREKFANDVGNLLAVQKQANQDKGSKTPDQWQPREDYRCDYARRWIAVKSRWELTVQPTEKTALADMLETCGAPASR
ncbi:HNH endonuclease family protein [Nocardia huaxiensis]|uniref:HNH endonuclease family protein n=1 Tax=Nocardia huaxiensis TaxID=2755382 RepID=UPI001E2C93AB|nr:HNH endonuclease family protein [Nocardia huaxiensis]UFS96955.1 HNH endonuclease family protein [Nocardia huaxiensis]